MSIVELVSDAAEDVLTTTTPPPTTTTHTMTTEADLNTEGSFLTNGFPDVTFSIVDYCVFILMVAISFIIGVYTGWKSQPENSGGGAGTYLLGGRSMNPAAVSLSLLGGSVSAIAILGNASEVYIFGTQICMNVVGMMFGGLLIYHVILPVLCKMNIVSLSEYLEVRFRSVMLRRLGSLCLILSIMLVMAVVLYAPSLALATVTGLSSWASVIIMGGVCTIYTAVGGVRGVIYTDVLQTTTMYVGVVVVLVYGCLDVGGLSNIWEIASNGSRIQFFELDPSPFLRHSMYSTIIHGFYLIIFFYGINQAAYQRYCAVGSLKIAKRLCIIACVGCMLLFSLNFLAGLTAFAVYSGCDPLASGKIKKLDQILPYFVAHKLGHLVGVPGLFVAAVYGGVLSSVSSSSNAMACMIWDDLLSHVNYFKSYTDKSVITVLKVISLASGVVGLLLALLGGRFSSILQLANSIVGTINGPLIGLYLTGMCSPWVGEKGACVGFLTAFIINIWYFVGNLVRGKITPTHLPLSTDDCPGNLTTIITTTTTTQATLTSTVMEEFTHDIVASKSLYDISYCYIGLGGILITIITSSLASMCTGMLSPWELDDSLVHPQCARLHGFLWRMFKGSKSGGLDVTVKDKESVEEKGQDNSMCPSRSSPTLSPNNIQNNAEIILHTNCNEPMELKRVNKETKQGSDYQDNSDSNNTNGVIKV